MNKHVPRSRRVLTKVLCLVAKLFLETGIKLINVAHELLTICSELANLRREEAERYSAHVIMIAFANKCRPCKLVVDREKSNLVATYV